MTTTATTTTTATMTLEEKTNDLVATFQKILESPEPFANEDEKETCQRLVEALPEGLVNHAANTSYAYWSLASQPDTCPSEETKIAMAMREARRHLLYMCENYDKGLANFTESCQYRKVRSIGNQRGATKRTSYPTAHDDGHFFFSFYRIINSIFCVFVLIRILMNSMSNEPAKWLRSSRKI